MIHSILLYLKRYSFYFGGDQPLVSFRERLRACFGAFIGLFVVIVMAKALGEFVGVTEWLMASLGASALLVFTLPQSPMAQPWAVIAGNLLSGLIGITTVHWVDRDIIAIPLVASLSIMGMFLLRCLHPPADAVAMIVVLGQVEGYRYAFFPVMVDSVFLILAGSVYSNFTGKQYPNRPTK